MKAVQSKPLGYEWKQCLDLSTRTAPEFFENADGVRSTPHAGAIRTTLRDLGASAIFCVQNVPTIVIISVDEYDRDAIVNLHAALWNQALASLILVLSGDTVRAFSLARIPHSGENHDFDDRCLVGRELNSVTDALVLKDIIYSVESGRLWEKNADYFQSKERIDQFLLNNLTASHQLLCDTGLRSDAAQALLIQTMFVAYLEDRKIIGRDYFLGASDGLADSFSTLLELAQIDSLDRLFKSLRKDFNGDLFVAPCSFEVTETRSRLTRSRLKILASFRSGREEMSRGAVQRRFWGYNFKYIPIELISAVYDRFLAERETDRRRQGAYYTPMFLADTVISQVWDTLSSATRDTGHFLDPACGSGVFLVRSFQRLCEHWRETQQSQNIRWKSLLGIFSRLHGWDLNSTAVRVAVFSLYIALLEEVSPPDIRLLIRRGKLLPQLWGQNLRQQDFFTVPPDDVQADVLIGNPPWSSRHGGDRRSVQWCIAEHLPIPNKEVAWAFVWKSLRHVRADGTVAFLLPAMALLHNQAKNAVAARNRFMRDARVYRIINFADLRFQLFEGAVRSAALVIFGHPVPETPNYQFDYWAPKADLNLKMKRVITLSNADKCLLTSRIAEKDPLTFKRRLWINDPEAKLFNYLSTFSKLGDLVDMYGTQKRKRILDENQWLIGQGFQPSYADQSGSYSATYSSSHYIGKLPYLPVHAFRPLAQPAEALLPWHSNHVRRKGFEQGFTGPRVLIPSGVKTAQLRLRATYLEEPLTFQHTIQALIIPRGDERRAKLLAALLNSRLILWFAFHGTASFGAERPEVLQAELLRLPFPAPEDMPEPKRSQSAESAMVSLIDKTIESMGDPFELQTSENEIFRQLDRLAYEYFCLSDEEITLVEDTVERVIPAVQPTKGGFPEIWRPSDHNDRRAYANTLVRNMADWFDSNYTVAVRLEAHNDDLAVLCLSLQKAKKRSEYIEDTDVSVGVALSRLFNHIHQPLPGNFQLIPNFRVFFGRSLYLVKPAQKRFWLRSAALADADAIALDLQDAAGLRNERSNA